MSDLRLGSDGAIETEGIVGDDDPRIIRATHVGVPTTRDDYLPGFIVTSVLRFLSRFIQGNAGDDPDPPLVGRKSVPVAPSTASFGMDGIAVDRGFFIPYTSIARMKRAGDQVTLAIRGGDLVAFAVAYEERWRVHARIERGRTRAGTALIDDVRMLAQRPDEPEPAWRARVAAMTDAGGYRAAPFDRARLWSVARDPVADPSARAGACALLREGLTSEEARALGEVRDETAHPRVRSAIEAVLQPAD
jgi:hypothetical protein